MSVASSVVPFASTAPVATISVPTGIAAVSPSAYLVALVTLMVRVNPSRSLIRIVDPLTDVTAPSRCGWRTGLVGVGAVDFGVAVPEVDVPEVVTATAA